MVRLQCDDAECRCCVMNPVPLVSQILIKRCYHYTGKARATKSLIVLVEVYIASVTIVCILLVLDGLARGPEASTEKLGFMLHPPSQ
jgi:hypothetical protein